MIYDRFLGMYLGNYLGTAVSVEKPFHSYIFEWFIPSYLVILSYCQSYFTIQTAGPDSFLQEMEESKSNVFIDIVRF